MEKFLFGVQEGETPLPYKRIITVTMLLFAESINGSAIFSYVPYLVLDFKPGALHGLNVVPESLAGYYAGLVASSFFFGQLLSSYFWGNLSDKFGRRPVLLFGSLGSLFANLCFGFGRNFWWFVFFRFLTGFLNGNVGVAKSYIGEFTDSTNQSRGLSFIGLSSGGVFIGAFMGGILARPAKQYPSKFSETGLLGTFPYLAPSLFGVFVIAVGLVLAYFFVEENPKKTKVNSDGTISEKPSLSIGGILKEGFGKMFAMCTAGEGDYSVFKDKIALWSCLNYALIGLFMIFDAEIWPLLSVLKPSAGGLGFSTREIGIAQAVTGISFTIVSLFLQTRITNKMGFINASVLSALVWAAQNLVTPYIHFASFSPVLMWSLVVLNRLVRGFVGQLYFGCSMALINNAVIKEHLGAINGVGQTFVAMARTFGPFLSANIFAWSATSGLSWPFNQHFVYLLVVCLCFVGALEAYLLPRSLNTPKEEQFAELKQLSEGDDHEGVLLEVDDEKHNGGFDLGTKLEIDSEPMLSLEDSPRSHLSQVTDPNKIRLSDSSSSE